LQRINDQWVLQPAVETLIDTLDRNSATLKQRQYAAVAVSATVRKIKNEAFLEGILQPLVMSTTQDPDKGVREYAGRAFLNVLNKVDDEAVLEPALGPLVETLGHKEVKMHRYAAWALANLVPKIRNEATLKQIIAPLTAAKLNGRHPHVREYCRRALKSIQTTLKQRSATGPKE
jgi:HEAT repeat protein